MRLVPVRIAGRELEPHKAVVSPLIGSRTVLTNNPWTFVGLWLQRNEKDTALFYWNQAEEFYKASIGLPLRSAPLLLYYSYMNAAKALLSAEGVSFNEYHGVSAYPKPVPGKRRTFKTEGIKVHDAGVLPSLAAYYGETETSKTHSLQQLLFNMVFIHRTYALTFAGQREMYVPLTDCKYMVDKNTKEVFFTANVSEKVPRAPALRRLPASFVTEPTLGPLAVRSKTFAKWRHAGKPNASERGKLSNLNRSLRMDLRYIAGAETLWYLRLRTKKSPGKIDRQISTMVLAAMHRLSEICRYRPLELDVLLSEDKNWLLSEFISQSPSQFIDEMASEITGHQFLAPNVRKAT